MSSIPMPGSLLSSNILAIASSLQLMQLFFGEGDMYAAQGQLHLHLRSAGIPSFPFIVPIKPSSKMRKTKEQGILQNCLLLLSPIRSVHVSHIK